MKLISVFFEWQVWRNHYGRLMLYSNESSTSQWVDETLENGVFEHEVDHDKTVATIIGSQSPVRMWLNAVVQSEEQAREEHQVE